MWGAVCVANVPSRASCGKGVRLESCLGRPQRASGRRRYLYVCPVFTDTKDTGVDTTDEGCRDLRSTRPSRPRVCVRGVTSAPEDDPCRRGRTESPADSAIQCGHRPRLTFSCGTRTDPPFRSPRCPLFESRPPVGRDVDPDLSSGRVDYR